jgi:hypothetical protein
LSGKKQSLRVPEGIRKSLQEHGQLSKAQATAASDSSKQQAQAADASVDRKRSFDEDLLTVNQKSQESFEDRNKRATFWLPRDFLDELDEFSARTKVSKATVILRGAMLFMKHYGNK